MRVTVFMKAAEGSENAAPPTMEAFEAMERFTEALVAAGLMVAGAGLKPTSAAKQVIIDGAGRTVVDGPFVETGDVVAGWSIWEVRDMDEALAWVKRCPNPMSGPCKVEIRPFIEASDMGEMLAPEMREKLGVA
jgi:hypothetical protein